MCRPDLREKDYEPSLLYFLRVLETSRRDGTGDTVSGRRVKPPTCKDSGLDLPRHLTKGGCTGGFPSFTVINTSHEVAGTEVPRRVGSWEVTRPGDHRARVTVRGLT